MVQEVRLLAAFLAVGLLAAACGSDDDASSGDGSHRAQAPRTAN